MDAYAAYPHHHSVLVIRSNAVSDLRMDTAAYHLKRAGFDVEIITEVPFYKASQFDTFLCCRPGDSMIRFLNTCLQAGKQVIVDLDDDFNSIPKHNPAFIYTGAGHPTYLTELKRLLQSNVVVTYASEILADRYHKEGIIIPNTWDDGNDLWLLPKLKRNTFNIGFLGTATHREDFNLCEAAIKRILKNFPQTRLVVGGDEQIYNRFVDTPEERKLFLPGVPYADYPLMFRLIDMLVVPLRDTHFNRAKSDIKLVEAGATFTPWVASPMPVYQAWEAGGTFAGNSEQEWYESLAAMIGDSALRQHLAASGNTKAQQRRASLVCNKWIEIMGELSK